jgi:hypothetical protein
MKMIRVQIAITVKREDKIAISQMVRSRPHTETTKYPVPSNSIFNKIRNKIYLNRGLKDVDHFIKSLIMV